MFVIGCLGIAGYAMLLFFMRALAVTHSADHDLSAVSRGTRACSGFLYGWAAALYLGELLLAIALLRHTIDPRWIPIVLIAHVLTFPLSAVLPDNGPDRDRAADHGRARRARRGAAQQDRRDPQPA